MLGPGFGRVHKQFLQHIMVLHLPNPLQKSRGLEVIVVMQKQGGSR